MLHILIPLLAGLTTTVASPQTEAVVCQAMPTASRATLTLKIETANTYRLWLKQLTPHDEKNPLLVQLDAECPVAIAKNASKDSFDWVGSNADNRPLVYPLTAGEHTVTIAGEQTNQAADVGLFTSQLDCAPIDAGENCEPTIATVIPEPATATQQPSAKSKLSQKTLLALAVLWTVALVGLLTLLFNKYHAFLAQHSQQFPQIKKLQLALQPQTARHFVKQHVKVVAGCGAALLALIIALILGVTVLASANTGFEIEAGVLSGDARKISDPLASGGSYVAFGATPDPQPTPSNPQPATPNPGGNGGGGNGGGSGGGGTGGGGSGEGGGENGGGNQYTLECPAYPAFPNELCTGWRHTGVTLTDCTNQTDNGYIWDSNLTFDKCYFSKPLTIYGNNITITRSQVHGTITPHWSKNYSFGNLTLVDVEIEQTGDESVLSAAVAGHNYSCLRCDVHHTITGMHFGDNVTITDSYTHDFQWRDGAHGAGIGAGQGHGSNSRIIHNNIQCNRISGPPICSSALSIYPETNDQGGTLHNVDVERNLFNATGAYCVYAGGFPATNINFRNNHFGKKFYPGCAGYGPVTSYTGHGVWEGNIWDDGSGPVIPS